VPSGLHAEHPSGLHAQHERMTCCRIGTRTLKTRDAYLLLQDLVFVFSDFAPASTRAKDTVASPFACVQHLPGNRTAQRVCAAPGFKRLVVDFVQVQQASAFTQLRRPGQRAWQDARGTLSEGRPAVRKRVREPAAEAEIERMTWPRISSMLMSSRSSMADRNERLLMAVMITR
jgi:hypothetical protein